MSLKHLRSLHGVTSRFCFLDSHRLHLSFRVLGNSWDQRWGKLSDFFSEQTAVVSVAYLAAPSTQIKLDALWVEVWTSNNFAKRDVSLSYFCSPDQLPIIYLPFVQNSSTSDPGHCPLKITKDAVKAIKTRARRSSEAPVPLVARSATIGSLWPLDT